MVMDALLHYYWRKTLKNCATERGTRERRRGDFGVQRREREREGGEGGRVEGPCAGALGRKELRAEGTGKV